MLFYLIFISQIVLVSWYIPQLMKQRMLKVMRDYPQDQYPKLYVRTSDQYHKMIKLYAQMNQVLLVVGLCFLSAMIIWQYTTKALLSPMVPWSYFMLQMIPMIMMEVKACQAFKLMRKNNSNSTKRATIKPRRLLDFISKQLLTAFFVSFLVAMALVFYHYGVSQKSLVNLSIIAISNVFFMGVIYWNIYGKRKDPYQSEQDRLRNIEMVVTSIIYINIAVNVFLAAQMMIKIFAVPSMKVIVMSLYCQLIVLMSSVNRLHAIKVEDIDFDVYKADVKQVNNTVPE